MAIYLYSAHRAVIFVIAQLSCLTRRRYSYSHYIDYQFGFLFSYSHSYNLSVVHVLQIIAMFLSTIHKQTQSCRHKTVSHSLYLWYPLFSYTVDQVENVSQGEYDDIQAAVEHDNGNFYLHS